MVQSLPTVTAQQHSPGPAQPAWPRRRSGTPCTRDARRRRPLQASSTGSTAAVGGSSSGGGVLILPGFLSSSRQYATLVQNLRAKGYDAEVVPVATSDWFPALAGSSFEWYLSRLDTLLQDMHAKHGRIALVGHSAGGWLARILLGGEPYQGVRYGRSPWVHTLLTLGTPHQSIENYPLGRAEESLVGPNVDSAPPAVRGSTLQFANYFFPDAASLGGVRVVCACGDAIRGRPLWGEGSSSSNNIDGSSLEGKVSGSSTSYASAGRCDDAWVGSSPPSRWDAYMAYEGYKSGCGRGDVDGDGVTPLCIAYLPGAEQLVMPGVWHIPQRNRLWYGDGPVQDLWLQYLREPQGSRAERP